MPTCSIITPTYNSARFLKQCMESVAAQSFTDYELIVSDDGSTDESIDIIESYADADARIRLVSSGRQSGAAAARNRAIEVADGRYIAFLDSDDVWYSSKLERQLASLEEGDASFCYSAYDIIDESGAIIAERHSAPEKMEFSRLLGFNPIGCLTVVVDRKRTGDFRFADIRMRNDWATWIELLKAADSYAVGIRAPLAALRMRQGSLTSSKLRATMYTYRMLRRYTELGPLRASINSITHGVRSIATTRKVKP